MVNLMDISRLVLAARTNKNITQKAVAEMAGVSLWCVCRFETGHNINLQAALCIAAVVGVTLTANANTGEQDVRIV